MLPLSFFALILRFIIVLACTWLFVGCFATRTPEPPDLSRSQFIPPTSPQIVIDNFRSSLRDKFLKTLYSCLLRRKILNSFFLSRQQMQQVVLVRSSQHGVLFERDKLF